MGQRVRHPPVDHLDISEPCCTWNYISQLHLYKQGVPVRSHALQFAHLSVTARALILGPRYLFHSTDLPYSGIQAGHMAEKRLVSGDSLGLNGGKFVANQFAGFPP